MLNLTSGSISGPTSRFHQFSVFFGAMILFSVALIGAISAGAVPTAPRGDQAAEALRNAGVV